MDKRNQGYAFDEEKKIENTDLCVMNLNHLNLTLPDIPAARIFFESYLDFKTIDPKPNDTLSVLTGENGFVLVLMNESMNKSGGNSYPDNFHFGFYVDSEKAVNDFYNRLKSDGYIVGEPPRQIRKTYGFYLPLQNVLIEIMAASTAPSF